MRYFIVNYKNIRYRFSGKSVNSYPVKHLTRTLIDYEIFLIEKGTLDIKCNDREYSVKEDEFLMYSISDYQEGTAFNTNAFYWLHFDGEITVSEDESYAENYCKEKGYIYFAEYFKPRNIDYMITLLNQINHFKFESGAERVTESLLSAVVCEIARQYATYKQGAGESKIVSEIKTFISLHAETDITVESLAEKYLYNAKYLGRLFSAEAGVSIKTYITEQRVEKAKRLLLDSRESVNAIARAVGFNDEFYFMRVFKRLTGSTPSEFRKEFNKSVYS